MCRSAIAIAVFLLGAGAGGAAQLPLFFEPNQGQAPAGVEFISRANGVSSHLTGRQAQLHVGSSAIGMELVGATGGSGEGITQLPGFSSYFAADRRDWHTRIPQYDRVRYREVYPGIDLVYYGNQGKLEYDFIVAPGADPSPIRLAYRGQRNLRLDGDGSLVLVAADGEIRQRRPVVYQEIEGRRTSVKASYRLARNGDVRIDVGAYDTHRPLIVDPVLEYGTFLGANTGARINGMKIDASGNLYLAGSVPATPASTGSFAVGNAIIIKFSPSQNRILYYATLVSDGKTQALALDIDSNGYAYICGRTGSADFPLVNAFQTTRPAAVSSMYALPEVGFVTRLAVDGQSLVYSTYFGGSKPDFPSGIAVDAGGNAFITGQATSTDMPVRNALKSNANFTTSNTFLAKFTPAGALQFSTYFGGSSTEGGQAIALDRGGYPIIVGFTQSADFPSRNPVQAAIGTEAAFAAKFTPDGQSVVFATPLGGTWSAANTLVLDPQDNIWVSGFCDQPAAVPLVNPLQTKATKVFISKLNAAGNQLLYQSYFGGSVWEDVGVPQGLALDSAGHLYIAGATYSPDFPLVNSMAPYRAKASLTGLAGAGSSAYVSELSADGQRLIYSTVFGGTKAEDRITAITVDSAGALWAAGFTGSDDFPLKNAYQASFTTGSTATAFLVRLTSSSEASGASFTSSPGVLNFSFATGGATPSSQTLSIGTSTGATATFSATASTTSGGSWLSVNATSGSTPAQIAVSVNPASLANGAYSGVIHVSGGNFNALDIPVWLTVSAPASILQASAYTLAFDSSTAFMPGVVYVRATDNSAVRVTATTTTNSGGNWLSVTPTTFTTTGMINIWANTSGLGVGTYTGYVHLAPPSGSGIDIAVILQVSVAQTSARLIASPASVTAVATAGATSPVVQSVSLTASSGTPAFSATVVGGASWLTVSPASGAVPASLYVSMNPAGLSSGVYNASVHIASANATSVDVPVTFSVTSAPAAVLTSLSPATITAGAIQPVITLQGSGFVSGSVVHLSVAGLVTDQVLATSHVDSNTLQVTLPLSLLVAGRSLNLSVVNPGAPASNALAVTVISAAPSIAISSVKNAASLLTGPVAPGELVTLMGTALGPSVGVNTSADATGVFPTSVSGVRVLFDGRPAPLLYVSAKQINAIVPFSVSAAQGTSVQVEYQSARSAAVTLAVALTAPGLFTMDASGIGQGAFLNADMNPNLVASPAAPGSTVALYATGGGQMSPALTDGVLVPELANTTASVAVTIDGQPALVSYSGAAPTLVAGMLQINVTIPSGVRTGTSVPVTLRIGDGTAQSGVTLAIR